MNLSIKLLHEINVFNLRGVTLYNSSEHICLIHPQRTTLLCIFLVRYPLWNNNRVRSTDLIVIDSSNYYVYRFNPTGSLDRLSIFMLVEIRPYMAIGWQKP